MSARKAKRRSKRTLKARYAAPRLSSEDIETARLALIGVIATCELVRSSASRSAMIVLTRGALKPLHETLRLLGEKDPDFTTCPPSGNFERWENVMKRSAKAKRGRRATGKRVALDPLALFLPVLDLLAKAIDAVSEAVDSRDVELFRGKVSELRNACIVTELAMRAPRCR